jgi:hypothetical protein
MNCTLCNQPAPKNVETMIDEDWIPSYFSGQQHMPGPVCPECCQKYFPNRQRRRVGDGRGASGCSSLELTPAWFGGLRTALHNLSSVR